MTWRPFKMSDSLLAKELVKRAIHIVTTYGSPGKPPFGPDMWWEADDVSIFYDGGESWYLSVRSHNHSTRVYEAGMRITDPYCAPDPAMLQQVISILRKHMVLDDLASAGD